MHRTLYGWCHHDGCDRCNSASETASEIGKFVPSSSIAGFLFVLGIFKTVVLDAPSAFAVNAAVGGTTMVVTAVTNPFLGMLAGVAAKLLGL